ncbi:MAG TPA: hypothetical protein DD740_07305 [Chryseobacterium sp.]|nr:hypothetical protein [Chryseobacterium sp.]
MVTGQVITNLLMVIGMRPMLSILIIMAAIIETAELIIRETVEIMSLFLQKGTPCTIKLYGRNLG